MPTLLWFRRDLRLHDLPALLDAAAADGEVLACYVLDPRLKASSGPRRLQYLYDALRDLREHLDGRLLVTRGRPEQRIPKLVKAIGATSVHVSADYSPFGRRRDGAVRDALGDVPLEESGSPYLVSPGRVTKDDGTPYKVFTPFYDAWRRHGWRRPAKSGASSARWIDPADAPGGVDIPDAGVELELPAGETAAASSGRSSSTSGLDDYADDRNRPDLDATSRMSAHLKFGTIHPRTMAADLGIGQGRAGVPAGVGFPRLLCRGALRMARQRVVELEQELRRDRGRRRRRGQEGFEAWKAGRTGFPIVDAGMRQLAETGFMHNRVRMIVASFLVKDLHLPWQWGARWFLEQLVDGDMANNQHGWQWAAGCGTDAAPYFRVFNPTTQGKKFDPDGDLRAALGARVRRRRLSRADRRPRGRAQARRCAATARSIELFPDAESGVDRQADAGDVSTGLTAEIDHRLTDVGGVDHLNRQQVLKRGKCLGMPALQNLLPVEMIDAADISEAMIYLCGQSGRYITGICPAGRRRTRRQEIALSDLAVAAQRLLALGRVVDDRLGIVVVVELGHPAPYVVAVRVELLALCRRVEHPEVRRGVGAAARRPLPAVLVVGHVAVDQLLEKPPRAPLPRQVQILDQKRRDDHPHPVVHEPGRGELAHAGVDDREARPAGLPRLEPSLRLASSSTWIASKLRFQFHHALSGHS